MTSLVDALLFFWIFCLNEIFSEKRLAVHRFDFWRAPPFCHHSRSEHGIAFLFIDQQRYHCSKNCLPRALESSLLVVVAVFTSLQPFSYSKDTMTAPHRVLSDEEVYAVFDSVHNDTKLPDHLKFHVIAVDPAGGKISPPRQQFQGTFEAEHECNDVKTINVIATRVLPCYLLGIIAAGRIILSNNFSFLNRWNIHSL